MGSHVKTQNRGRTVLVLCFPFFPLALGGQNSQTHGLRLGILCRGAGNITVQKKGMYLRR